MASMPLAFSIHNFISSVGADAGFAAIIGLAVLVLLYFAHARETANLREEAALLTQRLMQAEARVAQLSRAQPAVAPAPAGVARPVAVASPAPAGFPFAPAGLGAPALAAATRVVPLARPAAQPTAPPGAPQFEPAESYVPAPAAIPQPAGPDPFERERAVAPVAAPAPATVAGANGAAYEPVAAAAGVATQDPPLPPRQPPPRTGPPAGRGQLPPLRPSAPRRSRWRRVLAILIGAAGVAAVVAALLIATSGGTSSPRSTRAARTTNTPTTHRQKPAAPFSPASVTVAVLNGTNTNQLAHTVGSKLAAMGYKEGALLTAASQGVSSTIVSYFPGAQNRTDATHVASSLKLTTSSVQPIDSTTAKVACSGAATCAANVVVTVGADLSTL
ncbi:MAG TPA: LytR C-terminal domain-containing protein [Solirubrobacteraceae bacterium]|nr:LytR C-terminal domain-containing protein [Solirubrobacteraceae bacterium]